MRGATPGPRTRPAGTVTGWTALSWTALSWTALSEKTTKRPRGQGSRTASRPGAPPTPTPTLQATTPMRGATPGPRTRPAGTVTVWTALSWTALSWTALS